MLRFVVRLWERWFGEPLRKVEADSLAYRLSPSGGRADWQTVAVLMTAAGCLTLQHYAYYPDRVAPVVATVAGLFGGPAADADARATLDAWTLDQSARLTWAMTLAVVCYVVIPGLLIKLAFRGRIADYAVGVRGVIADWPVYLGFAAVMVPLVYLFSAEQRFQDTYPFYRVDSRDQLDAGFVRYELLYALQFVSLEFFFRGFMVHGTKHRFGLYSVFVMTIPYCMIHFQKPLPETCGAVVAGVALGLVSLVTRSIWPGAALHIMVAWGMDGSCLIRRGLL